MEEMILAQPRLVEPTLRTDGPRLAGLRAAIREAARTAAPIVVTGCGTSEHGAMAVAALLNETFARSGLRGRAEARQALDAALDPRRGGVCIAVSHDGGTRATRLALQAATREGAATALVTACNDPECVADVDWAFVTPRHDESWCHTLAYTSAILAGANIAGDTHDDATVGVASEAIESTLARRADLEALASHLDLGGRIVTAGLGIDQITAGELALKIAEGVRVPTTAYHLETLLHGHLAGCDAETTSLVLLGLDARRGGHRDVRFALAARAAEAIGIPTVAIAPGPLLAMLPESVHGVALDPVEDPALGRSPVEYLPLLSALLQSAVALQLLTLALVVRAGTNPDLIRREERPWRDAATVAEETPDW